MIKGWGGVYKSPNLLRNFLVEFGHLLKRREGRLTKVQTFWGTFLPFVWTFSKVRGEGGMKIIQAVWESFVALNYILTMSTQKIIFWMASLTGSGHCPNKGGRYVVPLAALWWLKVQLNTKCYFYFDVWKRNKFVFFSFLHKMVNITNQKKQLGLNRS